MPVLAPSRPDVIRAVNLFCAVGGHHGRWVVSPGQPIPKARARSGKGNHYTPARTQSAQDALVWELRGSGPFAGNVAVACVFYRKDATVVDDDNLLKLVLDAGNDARIWRDDSQVTALAGLVELDRDDPRTIIVIGEHRSSLPRHVTRVK